MNKLKIQDKAELFFCILTVFFIPLLRWPVRFLIVFWILLVIINVIRTKSYKQIINFRFSPLFLLPIFYLLHIFALLYTDNIGEGLFNLEIKMTLLIVPLCLFFRQDLYRNTKLLIIRTFLAGCILSFLINFINALLTYLNTENYYVFFYFYLANGFHPTYLSIYIITAIFFLLEYNARELFYSIKYSAIVKYVIVGVFVIYVLLLISKAAIISLVFLFAVYFYVKIRSYVKSRIIAVCFATLLFFAQLLIVNNVPVINYRFDAMSKSTKQYVAGSNDNEIGAVSKVIDGTTLRINLWLSALSVAKTNIIFGTGPGDAIVEINKKIDVFQEQEEMVLYNAHNQYLQSFMALGVIGVAVLLWILIYAFILAIRKSNFLFLFFIILFSINMLFESLLEQQLGVIYFAFFYSFFYIWENKKSIAR